MNSPPYPRSTNCFLCNVTILRPLHWHCTGVHWTNYCTGSLNCTVLYCTSHSVIILSPSPPPPPPPPPGETNCACQSKWDVCLADLGIHSITLYTVFCRPRYSHYDIIHSVWQTKVFTVLHYTRCLADLGIHSITLYTVFSRPRYSQYYIIHSVWQT